VQTQNPQQAPLSPNNRWVLAGPFARIHDRAELLEDLEQAVMPHTAPSVLVYFGFEGLKEQLEKLLEPDSNALLGRIAILLSTLTDSLCLLYEPRRGEFWGLFDEPPELVGTLLAGIGDEVDRDLQPLGIQTAINIVLLPEEALTPIAALRLADERCRQAAGNLRPARPRSAYARIVALLDASRRERIVDSRQYL